MSYHRGAMTVLAIDTAGPVLGIAIARNCTVVDSYEEDHRFRHVEDLVPAIERLLKGTGLAPAEIDAVAVSAGPGSFTGLRVGMATAKGFALARDLPVYSVATLDALARQEIRAREQREGPRTEPGNPVLAIVPILDARKGRVYGAVFDSADGQRRTEDLDLPLEELVRHAVDYAGDGRWVPIGPEASTLTRGLAAAAPLSTSLSAATGVAYLACRAISAGATPDDPFRGPTYLRGGDVGENKRITPFTGDAGGSA